MTLSLRVKATEVNACQVLLHKLDSSQAALEAKSRVGSSLLSRILSFTTLY